MDRSALSRKIRKNETEPTRTDNSTRDQLTAEEARRRKSGKIRTAKDSTEVIRVKRRTDAPDSVSAEDGPSARHFTVANVGGHGMLYLKPSRTAQPPFVFPPVTPPGTSDGSQHTEWPGARLSELSGTYTPRPPAPVAGGSKPDTSYPPTSMSNTYRPRRTRSHSFSSASDRERLRTEAVEAADFQLYIDGATKDRRPKSSQDLGSGLLDLTIPHYRLGTPRFSDRGTAYLHNSMYTQQSGTDDMRSSVFSRAEYDKLFPAPPGRAHGAISSSFLSRASTASQYLSPSHAATSRAPSRTPPTPQKSPSEQIGSAMYDKITASPDDPAFVRYAPHSAKIVAATPARLIVQITSPRFLDYELLSDFFLTYRAFLSPSDLAKYLISRLQWAVARSDDAGRIVRVRTFVALRHWILNYFADDFIPSRAFRQQFCDLVNQVATSLKQRADGGAGDLKIVGELKKCWRRTCALFWNTSDPFGPQPPEVDILPGGRPGMDTADASLRNQSFSSGVAPQASQPGPAGTGNDEGAPPYLPRGRIASIPVSPISEQSVQVLSCSIPLRKHLFRPASSGQETAGAAGGERAAASGRNPPLSGKPSRPMHGHKRSGSFSDALRDERAPLPVSKADSVDLRTLSTYLFTGGLIRGLLVEPSTPKVKLLVPISPGIDLHTMPGFEDTYFQGPSAQSAGVKRIIGNVRRALSSRQQFVEASPARSRRSATSSDSQSSDRLAPPPNLQVPTSAWQKARGPPRVDHLGLKVEESYNTALRESDELLARATRQANLQVPGAQQTAIQNERFSEVLPPALGRLNSHVTTGSRSIVIVDDTGSGSLPLVSGALPETLSPNMTEQAMLPQPLFRNPSDVFRKAEKHEYPAQSIAPKDSASPVNSATRDSEAIPMHDLAFVPDAWQTPTRELHSADQGAPQYGTARKSSSAQPQNPSPPPVRNQLRKRPGGDLKLADYVHDLEPLARPHSVDTFSTVSRSVTTSATFSRELSSPRFPSRNASARIAPLDSRALKPGQPKADSVALLDTHSSQPNLRPSFEVEAAKLAKLPTEDDGGIDDALAKLEGTYSSPTSSTFSGQDVAGGLGRPDLTRQTPRSFTRTAGQRGKSGLDFDEPLTSPMTETQGASIYHLSGSEVVSAEGGVAKRALSGSASAAPVLPSPSEASKFPAHAQDSLNSPKQVVAFNRKTKSVERVAKSDSMPKSGTSQGSFLLDDNESLSESSGISTDIADNAEEDSLGVRSFFFDDTVEEEPLQMQALRAPPTPPSTVGAPPSPERIREPTPLIPDVQRTLKGAASAPKIMTSHVPPVNVQQSPVTLRRVNTEPPAEQPVHTPFVLAYESEVLAEQLTIVEKDALDEIDWKELIELKWQQSPPSTRNWVDYLRDTEPKGVDIVIARFNLVIKWAVSECVLTQDIQDRARCLVKFIHIAAHAHRLRNYATTYQMTLALLSSDISRLRKTWSLVPDPEKQMLERLENLVQPMRNFHNLRAEMESGTTENGCIPFIGLYTHDLIYNSQKPGYIDPVMPNTERLINFERHQTAATIVKSLLRLLEASSRYAFKPQPEVLSRCLWMAALEDADLLARSKALE